MVLRFRVLGFRVLGFWVLGSGFRGLGAFGVFGSKSRCRVHFIRKAITQVKVRLSLLAVTHEPSNTGSAACFRNLLKLRLA